MSTEEVKLTNLYPLIVRKDEEAIKEFFFLMQPNVFHFLFRYIGNRAIAEDLTQDTFIKFWLSIDRLDPDQSCKAYLYKIARNIAINYHNRKPPVVRFEDDENLLLLYSKNSNIEIDAIFFMDDYQKAIDSLPERCKATFLLSRFSGFNYSEIAEILEVSIQTVKNQMNKALAVLRKRLRKHLD